MITAAGAAPQAADYRARTIYFLLADRFHPHQPYDPYVDPEPPEATNTVNCFEQPCAFEAEWRRYWDRSSDADEIFIDSYENDYDPIYPTRFYKHYQDYLDCQQAATMPDYQWSYWQLHHCLLADLSGYNQHDPLLAESLINAGKTWIDNGVDDFRLDAIKFPFPEFVARFTHSMIDYLNLLGRPAPYIVGEWSHGGVGDPKSLRFANHYALYATHILDFSLSLALNQFIGGAYEAESQQLSAQVLDQLLHAWVAAFHGRDTWQGTFIDNHDQMRTLVRLQKLGIASDTERQRRMDLATALLLTVRGIPIIFYGDEQYLARYADCDPRHPEYCEVAPEDVNAHDDDPYNRVGMTQWSEETPAFKIIATLAHLRRESPAIARRPLNPVCRSRPVGL